MCARRCTRAVACVWKSQNDFWGLVLAFLLAESAISRCWCYCARCSGLAGHGFQALLSLLLISTQKHWGYRWDASPRSVLYVGPGLSGSIAALPVVLAPTSCSCLISIPSEMYLGTRKFDDNFCLLKTSTYFYYVILRMPENSWNQTMFASDYQVTGIMVVHHYNHKPHFLNNE